MSIWLHVEYLEIVCIITSKNICFPERVTNKEQKQICIPIF